MQELNIRQKCTVSTKPYPFVKWPGGKRQLIPSLLDNLPSSFDRYFEPFLGGGALFFELTPNNAYISDANEELINVYKVVKNSVRDLTNSLKNHLNTKEYFLAIRNLDKNEQYKKMSDIEKASRFIYLNRTCFNGLYRVNSKGEFNVPFGFYKNPKILDENNLIACSKALQNVHIECNDFSHILAKTERGDFVYFDPPYMPLNETSNFTSYTKDGFDIKMQVKLKDVCDELTFKGVKFLLSNSDTQFINDLYKKYNIKKVFASRNINRNGDGRGKISEVLVRNY